MQAWVAYPISLRYRASASFYSSSSSNSSNSNSSNNIDDNLNANTGTCTASTHQRHAIDAPAQGTGAVLAVMRSALAARKTRGESLQSAIQATTRHTRK